jgi:hypothetical protein
MTEDDGEALRNEYYMMLSPGWAVFKASITEKFQEASAKLCFSGYKDDRERLHSEGHCQFFKWICDHESAVKGAWAALQEEKSVLEKEPEEEGGDLGLHYEASQ